jgi:mRNA interferase RelE/StbE
MYRIQYSAKVLKELNELENKTYLKVRERILSLEEDPRPVGSLKLTNDQGYRVRVGDFRILYEIDDINKTVKLLKIGNKKEIYRKK